MTSRYAHTCVCPLKLQADLGLLNFVSHHLFGRHVTVAAFTMFCD